MIFYFSLFFLMLIFKTPSIQAVELWEQFSPTTNSDQKKWYGSLTGSTVSGRTPISLPLTDNNLNFTGNNWKDACYTRALTTGDTYVSFWFRNGQVYCETARLYAPNAVYGTTFEENELALVEVKKARCPTT